MKTPSGESFYPAFYHDPAYDRQSLASVCEKLDNIPSSSKSHFLTGKSNDLGIKTPL